MECGLSQTIPLQPLFQTIDSLVSGKALSSLLVYLQKLKFIALIHGLLFDQTVSNNLTLFLVYNRRKLEKIAFLVKKQNNLGVRKANKTNGKLPPTS